MSQSEKLYQSWLIIVALCITIMVILGGYTRLTGSGLSITQWSLLSGILPPLSQEEWQILFSKYQEIPQFKLVNFAMDLSGFKQIFWLEYIHRLMGRVTGILIIIPAILFFKYHQKAARKFLTGVIFLILLQGSLGWFMVASGLKDNVSVDHFRLAAHLITAFILFSLIFAEILKTSTKISPANIAPKTNNKSYILVSIIFIILTIQVIYGAFVAGLDGGYIYNNFPLMGENFYPEELSYYLQATQEHNNISTILFYNPATVQFWHRMIAYLVIFLIFLLVFFSYYHRYPQKCKKIILFMFILCIIQISLGIMTILSVVNIHIAVMHQVTALILYGVAFTLQRESRLEKN